MQTIVWGILMLLSFSCKNKFSAVETDAKNNRTSPADLTLKQINDTTSWNYFLQHLPEKDGPVVDYKGQPISFQEKHFSVINYDVGTRDLQQCADALMRLRAEYLFSRNRSNDIGFHFTSGQYYSFCSYCKGSRPVPDGSRVNFTSSSPVAQTRMALRKYLDIVYTYAGTISLVAELKNKKEFSIGAVIIYPGTPGHCFIIVDEATRPSREKLFKLVEGYTPAQSIYVLQNTNEPALGYWHKLQKGTIETASYIFTSYQLKSFE